MRPLHDDVGRHFRGGPFYPLLCTGFAAPIIQQLIEESGGSKLWKPACGFSFCLAPNRELAENRLVERFAIFESHILGKSTQGLWKPLEDHARLSQNIMLQRCLMSPAAEHQDRSVGAIHGRP
jgi:hypothetical protein